MSHTANILIALGIVTVFIVLPYVYQLMKWHNKSRESWSTFNFDNDLKPENLRFSKLTGNLIIGRKEMPYPVYNDLPHLDASFRKWQQRAFVDKAPRQKYRGKAEAVNVTSISRRIFSVSVNTLYITGMLFVFLRKAGVLSFPVPDAFGLGWLVLTVWGMLLYALYFNSWVASPNGLTVGRWFFELSIPWSDIATLSLGFAREKPTGSRRSGFTLRLRYKDRALEIHSGKLESLLPLYDAVTAFRPDLKISDNAKNRTTASLIQQCLDYARSGDRDNALATLIEMKQEALPELMAEFRRENDGSIRALLVHAIWQHRQQSSTTFLAEALYEADPAVWQEAMDGLVTLASPQAMDALRAARARQFSLQRDHNHFLSWLEEAIEQTENAIQKEQSQSI